MIIFLYGEDSYRSKRKLEEIIEGYKKVRKSGLNLVYFDANEGSFKDFSDNFKVASMFGEKKLVILKNIFNDLKFQEDFLENIKKLKESEDIIVIYESAAPDKRSKFLKALEKDAKCQQFDFLQPGPLRKWMKQEFESHGAKISPDAENLLFSFVGNNLWQMASEIKKLSNYKGPAEIKKEDVDLQVKAKIESDIFKTIDALASRNKKQAIGLLRKHIEQGDSPLYLLSMISYQFRNLLTVKELQDANNSYSSVIKKSGLSPFVAKKAGYICGQFTMPQLKKIYQKIFQADSDIKTGKVDPETALDLLVFEV